MHLIYKLSIASDHIDMAQALLSMDIEMDGITYEVGGFSFYVPEVADHDIIKAALDKVSTSFPLTYEISELEDKNWNLQWESDFKTVDVRDYCRIRAPFHDAVTTFQHEIIIHPGMAFGTGHHETTWQMVDAMSKLDMKGKRVLDAGCGTGVLAILAAKEGASSVDAFDYDIHSVESAELNKGLNGVERIKVAQSDVKDYEGGNYDIIVANINRNVILASLASFNVKLSSDGLLITSGYLEVDLPMIQDAATTAGLTLHTTTQRGEWMCQTFM